MRRRLTTTVVALVGATILVTTGLRCGDSGATCTSFCNKYGYCTETDYGYSYYDYYDNHDDEGWTEEDQEQCEESCDNWRDNDDLYDCLIDCRGKFACHDFDDCIDDCYDEYYDYDDYYDDYYD